MSLIHKRASYHPINHYSETRPLYEIVKHEDGYEYLVQTGEKNQYDEIQSFADSVDFERILQRVSMGDTSMLRPDTDGAYVDTTNFPENPFEYIELRKQNYETFDKLPDDVKKAFNYDYKQFAQSVFDKSFDEVCKNLANQSKSGAASENNGGSKE